MPKSFSFLDPNGNHALIYLSFVISKRSIGGP
jgi:hypothetical protein